MAYDDSRFRSETGYRDDAFGSSGLDEAPEQSFGSGYPSAGYGGSDFGVKTDSPTTRATVDPVRPDLGDLDGPFDDPNGDRIAVHLLWESVLLLFAAAVLYLLHDSAPSALRGSALEDLLIFGTVVGLVTVGTGLSLRAAVPNLALGPVAYASAMFFAGRSDGGLSTAALITALAAVGVGAVIAVGVVGFHVPSWAASLGAALAVMVWLQRQHAVAVVEGAYQPGHQAVYWFAGFAAVAVVGGLLGLVRPLRKTVGAFRASGDPARRGGPAAATSAVLALVGSSAMAAVAGVLLALDARPLPAGENGLALTGLALGAALLGGTSAFGRRGGVFGTLLAVTLLVVLWRYGDARHWNLSPLAIGAAAILAGLVVTRLIETFGRGRPSDLDVFDAEPQTSWSPPPPATTPPPPPATSTEGWSSGSRTGGWATQLPARTTDDSWGVGDRWGA
jgi:ribose/xylose/arabinose/galactoside ABC-type transport system permease subunit